MAKAKRPTVTATDPDATARARDVFDAWLIRIARDVKSGGADEIELGSLLGVAESGTWTLDGVTLRLSAEERATAKRLAAAVILRQHGGTFAAHAHEAGRIRTVVWTSDGTILRASLPG
jgi:hypothetical protein